MENLGKSWEILGNLKFWEIAKFFLYFDEIIKWLLFPIRLGNFGKSWEILGNLEILFISMKLSNGCCFRFAWEILGDLGKSWEISGNLDILLYFDEIIKWLLFPVCLGNLGKSWKILGNLGNSWEILGNLGSWEIFSKNY